MAADGSIDNVVVVGGGMAAAKAVEGARESGWDGRLTVVTEEPHLPYERPPLSKSWLIDGPEASDVAVHGSDYYQDHGVDVLTRRAVTAIDRDAGELALADGHRLAYDRLLLATGAAPRRLPVEGADLDGVVTLRTRADSEHLAARLREVDHVTVVGAGWIGCEVAAAARSLDCDVVMADPLDVPLERVLGREVGEVFARLHRDNGVDVRTGTGVTALHGGEHVEAVSLDDGSRVDTELVVVGIGVTPRTELAEGCGLEVDDGIVVDKHLVTSDPRILAAGDVADAWYPVLERRVRVEHWAVALHQGLVAGRNLAGADDVHDRLPYFFTDQYDLGMEYVGHAADWDRVVFRGDPDDLEFIAFWLAGDRVEAAMNVNVWDVADDLRALVRSGGSVDDERLADFEVDLADLAD